MVLGTALLLTAQISCRMPAKELPKQKNLGVIFDTAYQPRADGPLVAQSLNDAYNRYHKTLAEPVAITAWGESCSHWNLFFATNRGIDSAGSSQVTPTNAVSHQVTFGCCETRMPGRKRGKDPVLASSPRLSLTKFPLPGKPVPRSPEEMADLLEVNRLAPAQFLQGLNHQIGQSTGKDLLIFVHGFNVDFEAAVIRTAQLGLDLPFNGGLCCYSWPSQGGIKNYGKDETVNAESVEPFRQFLQTVLEGVRPETKIQIVVHSMGNRMVMQTLDELSRQPGLTKSIDNVVLCAPDVGLTDFEAWVPGVRQMARRVTLYAGDSDTALIASKALHKEQRVGDAHPPVVIAGVETIDCSAVEMSLMGHSYYGGNVEVLCDLFSLLKEDQPASARSWLSPVEKAGQRHWKFTSQPAPVYVTWNFPPDRLLQTSSPSEPPTETQ